MTTINDVRTSESPPSSRPTPPPVPTKSIPPTEILTSESQIQAFTTAMAAAFCTPKSNPLTTAFITEIDGTPPPYPSPSLTISRVTTHFYPGHVSAFTAGATFICSPSITSTSALAIWEPPGFTGTPFDQQAQQASGASVIGPIRTEWRAHAARMRRLYLHGRQYYHLGFLGRNPDPEVEKVGGAVSAVVRPFLEKAREEDAVCWLEAASEQAKNVYEFWGFRVCEEVRFGVGKVNEDGWPDTNGKGIRAWGMVWDGRDA